MGTSVARCFSCSRRPAPAAGLPPLRSSRAPHSSRSAPAPSDRGTTSRPSPRPKPGPPRATRRRRNGPRSTGGAGSSPPTSTASSARPKPPTTTCVRRSRACEEADAQRRIARAPLLPAVGASADATRGRQPVATSRRLPDRQRLQSARHRELRARLLGQEPRRATRPRLTREKASRFDRTTIELTVLCRRGEHLLPDARAARPAAHRREPTSATPTRCCGA